MNNMQESLSPQENYGIGYDKGYQDGHFDGRNELIEYLLNKGVIREGVLGGEYVAVHYNGETVVSLPLTMIGD